MLRGAPAAVWGSPGGSGRLEGSGTPLDCPPRPQGHENVQGGESVGCNRSLSTPSPRLWQGWRRRLAGWAAFVSSQGQWESFLFH